MIGMKKWFFVSAHHGVHNNLSELNLVLTVKEPHEPFPLKYKLLILTDLNQKTNIDLSVEVVYL